MTKDKSAPAKAKSAERVSGRKAKNITATAAAPQPVAGEPPIDPATVSPSPVEPPPVAVDDLIADLDAPDISILEEISTNLAKAAITAQSVLAESALLQADQPAALNPDPFHVNAAMGRVISQLAQRPEKLIRAQAELMTGYMQLWQNAGLRMMGKDAAPVVEPALGDKRFLDPAWNAHPIFDVMKQSYLLSANWLNSLVAQAEDIDPLEKRRVEFFTKAMTDAMSPSNYLASNPAALNELIATRGESLVRGLENFAEDMSRGKGQLAISQTDMNRFRIGENLATTPGKVVFQNSILQLIQYQPTTETVHEIPLVIFTPWINKFYIVDLRPDNSMIRWLTGQGFTVFVTSWVNPDAELATKTFENYMKEGIYEATRQVMTQCGTDRVNAVGYCIGGTLLSCALAHMAAHGDERIQSATFFAAQQDFTLAGDLKLFVNDEWLAEIENKIDQAGGFLPGQSMADTFNSLRANDLIWSFFVNNYLMGKDPKPFDLLFWNSDQTRMPKTLHLFYLRNFYRDNKLAQGQLEMDGVRLDLGKVTTPVFVQSSREDHISPFRSVYRGASMFGGPKTFMLAGSGHIAGVINHPDANKYQHWVNRDFPDGIDQWLENAREAPGSWWPEWSVWLKERSGGLVAARDPSAGVLPPLEDAPGSFVQVRS